ncbi:hypothetical protein HGP14_05405 [Rhizobium sp. P32RR-XVIII]|uniref:hypothetical protein n=1 Tax=Rhizobium sp. P32RR-XVIII TaxID=2726738 RepID=UPI001457504F|nr:hypothetical protein [Rhizobium sp. P32RR-XVIII]NLS02808.1 hypothetical protein [Rhizobium sp. P32RR-XVIII]
MSLVVLTGASGSGKTAIAKAVDLRHSEEFDVRYFDSIGVPPVEEMIAEHGSPAGWQYAMTVEWMTRLAAEMQPERPALFEGQMRLAFLKDAAATAGIDCLPILVDCDDETRRTRLIVDRSQPEIAGADMMNWAAYLRREAEEAGCEILDTSTLTLDEAVARVVARLRA